VSEPPEFRDLVGDDLPPPERERLERVHELLIAAGPPPELPPELAEVPTERPGAEPTGLPRRRAGAGLALAAAIALVAFLGGYIAGHSKSSPFESVRNVQLGNSEASAVVKFGPKNEDGNTPMLVKVEGLRSLPPDDYYTLFMTKHGRPVVPCGSFRVSGPDSTTLHFTVAYERSEFDGLMLAHYRHSDHENLPLFSKEL
jgi:hypothetical protein